MTRRCSNCGHDGHNSRTCSDRGVVLFGVRLNEGGVRKSSSMGNLAIASAPMPKTSSVGNLYAGLGPNHGASPAASPGDDEPVVEYGSEDMAERSSSSSRERKKGTPWTEEEHRRFLVGLNKLGKGDWRGIARYYVLTRTPTQVASHAQKHFMRQINAGRRRRRSSLFDMVNAETAEPESPPMDCQEPEVQENPVQPEVEKENPIQSSSITSNDVNDSVIAEANHQPQTSLYNMPMQNKGCTSNNANKSVIEEANHQPQTSLYNFQLLNKGCTSDDANKSVKEEANQQPPPTTTAAAYNYPIPIPAYVSPFVQAPVIIWPTYNPGISGQLNYGAGTSGQPFYIAGPSWQPDYAGGAPGQSGHAVETSWRPSYIASTSGQASHAVVQQVHQIIKPTALHTKSPINVNELVDISNLSIGISSEGTASLPPAFDLNGKTQRQSAFHFKPLSSAD